LAKLWLQSSWIDDSISSLILNLAGGYNLMTDLNRGIMKFSGADSWLAVALSAVLILGSIAGLILWSLQAAYALR
jgi:hypothetical protein